MRKKIILITGANGEIGHGLINILNKEGINDIITLDIHPLSISISSKVSNAISGSILDKNILEQINSEYEITSIYHLAALLSTRAEFSPLMAHEVNVTGTLNLLSLAIDQAKSQGRTIKFFFPSSIAVYGMNTIDKHKNTVKEFEYCYPQTMYGCNKLYCENLGTYYANYYHRLSDDYQGGLVDFRAIRFPGIISASTVPSGGTSDFLPEMIHAASNNQSYNCFVKKTTRIPFMVMPDAISAIQKLMNVEKNRLSQNIFNVSAFNPSADEFSQKVKEYFPKAIIDYTINYKRQGVVDSWPAQIDDSAARTQWSWQADFNLDLAFENYLIQKLKRNE